MSSRPQTRSLNQNDKTKSSTSTSGTTKRSISRDDGWGGMKNYMIAKKYKLGEQFDPGDGLESGIFQGVAIFVSGYTKPSSDALRKLIVAHGGKFQMYLSKKGVTHIVATSLPNCKFPKAKVTPVVRPEWITESITAKKRLPYTSYLLFDNKPKLQAGLKSLPSFTTQSRNNSTSAISLVQDSVIPVTCVNTRRTKRTPRNDNDKKVVSSTTTQDLSPDSHIKTSTNDDDIQNEIMEIRDHKSGDEDEDPDSEIIYNSDEEDTITPQRLKNSLSVLIKRIDSCSPSNSYSSPKLKSLSSESEILSNCSGSRVPDKSYIHHNHSEPESITKMPNNQTVTSDIIPQPTLPPPPLSSTSSTKPTSVPTPTSASLPSASVSPSKQPPSSRMVAKAGDKGFLNEFYSNSRLHHISQWGAEFKAYVADIQLKGDASFPGRIELHQTHVENATRLGLAETLESARHGTLDKTFMHIDMDCFFVSVGILSRPELKGKPVAVTHSRGQGKKPDPKSDEALERKLWGLKKDGKLKNPSLATNDGNKETAGKIEYDFSVPKGSTGYQTFHSRAEIASCSYEARQKGLKNGMYMGRAKTLCPDLQTIPYDFDEYNRISRILYDIVTSHDVEAVSCDEMFVDCTDVLSDTGATALEFANLLRKKVFDKTGCSASVGIGPNILLARLATKKAKPNGVFQVFRNEAKDFIKDQTVSDLPGVGYSMSSKLTKLGVKTCGDLQSVPVSTLRREFGPKTGESLHRFSLGVDDREVKGNKQRKSVSAEVNYGIRFTQESDAIKFLQELSEEVARRLEGLRVKGRSITLKLMVKRPDAPVETAKFMGHGVCNTITKSSILPVATSDGSYIGKEVATMYRHHRICAVDVRGIGIQVQRLESTEGKDQQTSGHQSILHFTVNKKPNSSTAASTTSTNKSDVKGGKSEDTEMNDGFTSIRPNDKDGSSFGVSHNPNTDQETLPSSDVLRMRDVSFLLSPSQVNENVLDELPSDIAEELRHSIDQHKKRKNLSSTSSTASIDNIPNDPSTSKQLEQGGTLYASRVDDLISMSQVNENILDELPPDIAEELRHSIEQHKKQKKQGITSNATTSIEGNIYNAPSTSNQNEPTIMRGVLEDLPSMSQLDMNCFHALPRSLQHELESAYAAKQKQTNRPEGKPSPIKGTALEKLRSPSKDKKKTSRKRRGRPAGSKKKLQLGNVKLKSSGQANKPSHVENIQTVAKTASNQIQRKQLDFERDEVICLSGDDETSRGTCVEQDQAKPDANQVFLNQPSRATFCGAYTLKDVRCLFKEWINSCIEPEENDVVMVTDYLASLVHQKYLEHAFCLLRFLIRYVQESSVTAQWQQCIEVIGVHVQSVVMNIYGAELKLMG